MMKLNVNDKIEIKKRFINFLKREKCLDKYKANLNQDFDEFVDEKIDKPFGYTHLLTGAFLWNETPEDEGLDFWASIWNLWHQEINTWYKN